MEIDQGNKKVNATFNQGSKKINATLNESKFVSRYTDVTGFKVGMER